MRLFLAIDPSPEIKNLIEKVVFAGKTVPAISADERLIKRENWHLTLLFLGDQPDIRLGDIAKSMKRALAGLPTFPIELESVSYGPPGETKRMVWVNTSQKTSDGLERLKRALQDGLDDIGINFRHEYRKAAGHITLCRLRRPVNATEIVDRPDPISLSFEADSVCLMGSSLERGGAKYEKLFEVDLENTL